MVVEAEEVGGLSMFVWHIAHPLLGRYGGGRGRGGGGGGNRYGGGGGGFHQDSGYGGRNDRW